MIRTILSVTTTSIIALGAVAASAHSASTLDLNNDGKIDRQEFRSGHDKDRGHFNMMDTNKDGTISPEEYADGTLGRYDANKDGNLDEVEYKRYDADNPGVATAGQLPKPGDKKKADK
jgi:hypothetical protein